MEPSHHQTAHSPTYKYMEQLLRQWRNMILFSHQGNLHALQSNLVDVLVYAILLFNHESYFL